MDSAVVNSQVIDIINQAQKATMDPQVVLTSGAGKAYQSVAQSTAIAIQDATDALRNISTIATTATGVVVAQMLVGDDKNAPLLSDIQNIMQSATKDYVAIGQAAAGILSQFPSG
jgi:UDP-N-acetylmuramoylalanine-D-glutamate ligase